MRNPNAASMNGASPRAGVAVLEKLVSRGHAYTHEKADATSLTKEELQTHLMGSFLGCSMQWMTKFCFRGTSAWLSEWWKRRHWGVVGLILHASGRNRDNLGTHKCRRLNHETTDGGSLKHAISVATWRLCCVVWCCVHMVTSPNNYGGGVLTYIL